MEEEEKSEFQKEIEADAKRLNEIYDELMPYGLNEVDEEDGGKK